MMGSTVIAAVLDASMRCAEDNPNTHVAPAVTLWPDQERLWKMYVPAVRAARLGLVTLGEFDPAERRPESRQIDRGWIYRNGG